MVVILSKLATAKMITTMIYSSDLLNITEKTSKPFIHERARNAVSKD